MSRVKWTGLGLFWILAFQWTEARKDTVFLYHKFGDDVILPCTNVLTDYPNCSSTTWNHNRDSTVTTEVVGHGKFKGNPTREARLTLGHDCSLTVHNARAEDAGLYTCQQWPSAGPKYGDDAVISLSLLKVVPISKPKPSGQLHLKCMLFTYNSMCKDSSLSWRNDKGEEIQTARQVNSLNILTAEPYISRVTCQLAIKERVEVSIDYTRESSGTKSSSGETQSDREAVPSSQTNFLIAVAVGTLGLAAALLLLFASLFVRRRRRARGTQTQHDPEVSPGPPPTGRDQLDPEDGLTYVLINHSGVNKAAGKGQAQYNDSDGDCGVVGDSVTYATVKMTSACA